MADKVLTIEVGERITKVCVDINKKSLQSQHSFMFQTPEGCVTDGLINAPDVLAEALKAALAKHKEKYSGVVFALTSGRVAAREVKLPDVKEARIGLLVESNAHDYFPVDMTKYHISYTILDHISKGENVGYRVLVLAAPLNILQGYFKLAELVNLQILAIDYSGNSLYRALENKCGSEVTMVVDVNCTNASATFIKDNRMILQRVLNVGTDELVTSYMAAAPNQEASYLDTVVVLSTITDDMAYTVLPENDIRENLSRLVGNIVRAADYFNSSYWDTPVEKIVLTGLSSHTTGLAHYINEATSINTTYLESLPGFANLHIATVNEISNYLVCGGALIKPVCFLPPQFIKGKKKESKKNESIKTAVIFLGFSIVISIAMSAFAVYNYMSAVSDKAKLESKIAELAYTKDTYLQYTNYENSVADFKNLSAIAASPNDDLLPFIKELEEKMPSQIRVLSAACTQTEAGMNIVVGTKEEAATVIVQLRSFKSLSAVDVNAISEILNDNGLTEVSFAVRCTYVDTSPDPDVEAIAAAAAAASNAAETAGNAAETTAMEG